MERVVVWIDRPDGGREANVGTFERWLRAPNGRTIQVQGTNGKLRPAPDPEYAEAVYKTLDGYNGSSVADILADMTERKESDDPTGVLRQLASYVVKISANVVERQRRAEQNRLRARELAEIELSHLTVFFRAE